MKLILMHGRTDPDREMQDWGFHGPTLTDVTYVHSVYGNLTVGFKSKSVTENAGKRTGWPDFDEHVLEIRRHEDLIMTVGDDARLDQPLYFGDWELVEDHDPIG